VARKQRGRYEGSIYQRKEDGLWIGEVSITPLNGKRQRKRVYGKTKQEVQTKLRTLQATYALGRLTDPEQFTLGDFLSLWLDTESKPTVCQTTLCRYEQHIRLYLKPILGDVLLNKLTPAHVHQLYNRMAKGGASADARKRVGTFLRQILKAAVNQGLITNNPAATVPLPKSTKEEFHPLNRSQAELFITEAKADRLFALYVLALDSGMRQGELFGLQWPDFDWEAGVVMVQRSLAEKAGRLWPKEPKTGGSSRRIELSPATLEILREHRKRMVKEGNGSGPVFCDTEGKWLRKGNFYSRSFQRIVERANARAIAEAAMNQTHPATLPDGFRFHDLRHSTATLLLLVNENVKVVSERLGHKGIEVTLSTYSHVLPTMQKKAAEKMQNILGPLLTKDTEGKPADQGETVGEDRVTVMVTAAEDALNVLTNSLSAGRNKGSETTA
jgi:integrase